jgi:hypothetical protein
VDYIHTYIHISDAAAAAEIEKYHNIWLQRMYRINIDKLANVALKYKAHWDEKILDVGREIDGKNYIYYYFIFLCWSDTKSTVTAACYMSSG